jgi:hypothetical protein
LNGLFILSLFAFRLGDEKPVKTIGLLQKADGYQSPCHQTNQGQVIDWQPNYKLRFEDFKAGSKGSPGFAVATTSSAFGYSITDRGGEVSGSIYVRFYCEESWWNPDFRLDEVLEHEQLHFDICELFGRKFYKAVLTLRDNGNLNHRSMKRLKSEFEKQYDAWQGQYDSETDHGTKGDEQRKWNMKIRNELSEFSEYADYQGF